MHGDLLYWSAAGFAVILIGLSKGGFSGVSAISMPVYALVESPVRAAAIVLPILIVQDWVGVWAFRKDFSSRNLAILIPAAVVGIVVGWAMAGNVREAWVTLAIGVISIVFAVTMLAPKRFRSGGSATPKLLPGFVWGSISGFTSMISHSGGPPFLVYTLPQGLSPTRLAGTAALFFATVNLLKVPPYLLLGQFSMANLRNSALLLPVAVASTLAGVWMVRRISHEKFYRVILVVTLVVGLKLVWDAGRELLA